ncbi:MAG: carboxypeptidase-like regulatory domain-containing protein [Bacteroidales bacterium]|nr:carboxypeptidase-like regulatory domain-containing protein [Bacteroidales bacterium]
MKKLLFVMALVFSITQMGATEPENSSAPAKTNQIEGFVTDHVTGEALVGVCLKLKGSDKKTYTDLQGNFKIEDVAPGTYDIDIDYVSYKDLTLKSVSTASADLRLKVELESAHAL